jgi:hypothetical protein
MFKKFLEKWRTVEKPKEERVFNPPNWIIFAVMVIVSYGLGWALLYGLKVFESVLPRWNNDPVEYAFEGWAGSYFLYFFMMVIPLIIANIVYSKTKTAAYPFGILGGFLLSAASYMFIDAWFGGYMVYVLALSILANAMSQKEYKIKGWQLLYYFIFGIVAAIINNAIMMYYWDVWTFLAFIHVHLFVVIIAAVKIRQWGYMYMLGWALYSLFVLLVSLNAMFISDLFIFNYFTPNSRANMIVSGGYNLLVPALLVWVILTYFFKIQRKIVSKNIGL